MIVKRIRRRQPSNLNWNHEILKLHFPTSTLVEELKSVKTNKESSVPNVYIFA